MFLDMYFKIDIDEYIYIYKYNLYLYTIYIVYNYNVFVSTKMYLLRKLCICNCIYYDFILK